MDKQLCDVFSLNILLNRVNFDQSAPGVTVCAGFT